jgi:hypothetical protein
VGPFAKCGPSLGGKTELVWRREEEVKEARRSVRWYKGEVRCRFRDLAGRGVYKSGSEPRPAEGLKIRGEKAASLAR